MSWLRRINKALSYEPETWIAYLYGQQFGNLKNLREAQPRYKGWYFRLAIWVCLLLKNISFSSNPTRPKCEYLLFAGTVNQKSSLDSTLKALRDRKVNVCAFAPKEIISRIELEQRTYEIMSVSLLDFFKSLFLCLIRAVRLREQLKNKDSQLIRNRLDAFLNVYSSLVYFDRLLTAEKPQTVIVANDHTTTNRALIVLARNLGIKTVYMQHASVSKLFPALNVDYAFLDGQNALEIYRQCENNRPETSALLESRKVYLTGQKKKINLDENLVQMQDRASVGIALNTLDSVDGALSLVHSLNENKFSVRLRWHPALSPRIVNRLRSCLKDYNVDFSNPKFETLGQFFSKVNCMIAGNSSIHLEAALAHVVPIYYQLKKQHTEDYYGYVKNGLAVKVETTQDLITTIKRVKAEQLIINGNAIKFYSSTFGTPWEGREGELVVETLISLNKEVDSPVSTEKL